MHPAGSMDNSLSVTRWIAGLKSGDFEAAQRLWARYSGQMTDLARQRLGQGPREIADEDDIAQSVFESICRGAAAGRLDNVRDRDDLWWLLLALTKRKVVDHLRREGALKRGGSQVCNESELRSNGVRRDFSLDNLVCEDPTPEYLAVLEEESQRLLSLLRDDRLRQIALLRIEGHDIPEIAKNLLVSARTVERKLQLIRGIWERELLRGD